MEKNSRLRIDKELGVIDKIVPKITPEKSEVVPYQTTCGDDIEKDYGRKKDNYVSLSIHYSKMNPRGAVLTAHHISSSIKELYIKRGCVLKL